jgi:hypothetical protein
MTAARTPRPIFLLRVQPMNHVNDPVRVLRRVLKALKRAYGFRVLAISQDDAQPDDAEGER